METSAIAENVRELAGQFARDRHARQRRRELDPADFERVREAGFLLTGVPSGCGGIWAGERSSTRVVAELLRTLAQGDASVALVAAMHPTVLFAAGWLAAPHADPPYAEAWAAQREWAFAAARAGAWWGTIVSEPGSGGDVDQTRAVARRDAAGGAYRLSG